MLQKVGKKVGAHVRDKGGADRTQERSGSSTSAARNFSRRHGTATHRNSYERPRLGKERHDMLEQDDDSRVQFLNFGTSRFASASVDIRRLLIRFCLSAGRADVKNIVFRFVLRYLF
jgi:hypothetical protein